MSELNYANNIYYECKMLNKKSIGQKIRCAPTESKRKHMKKLIRYELMSLGSFGLAKLFR